MNPGEWIALAAFIVSIVAFIISIVASALYVGARIGKLEGKLNNGVFKTIDDIKASVRRLFEKWDDLPCERHDATLSQLKRMLETTDKKEENDA